MHVIIIKWWIIKPCVNYLKPFLFVQYHWKTISEMYIASPLWHALICFHRFYVHYIFVRFQYIDVSTAFSVDSAFCCIRVIHLVFHYLTVMMHEFILLMKLDKNCFPDNTLSYCKMTLNNGKVLISYAKLKPFIPRILWVHFNTVTNMEIWNNISLKCGLKLNYATYALNRYTPLVQRAVFIAVVWWHPGASLQFYHILLVHGTVYPYGGSGHHSLCMAGTNKRTTLSLLLISLVGEFIHSFLCRWLSARLQ